MYCSVSPILGIELRLVSYPRKYSATVLISLSISVISWRTPAPPCSLPATAEFFFRDSTSCLVKRDHCSRFCLSASSHSALSLLKSALPLNLYNAVSAAIKLLIMNAPAGLPISRPVISRVLDIAMEAESASGYLFCHVYLGILARKFPDRQTNPLSSTRWKS